MTERLNIHQRMAAVMKAVRGVAKTQRNDHGGYMYAGHERLTDTLRDHYVALGILRSASVKSWSRDDKGCLTVEVIVAWECTDTPSDRKEVTMLGEAGRVTKDGGLSPVQFGIALSYAVKNAEFKAFSLTGDDTPDSEESDTERVPELVLDFIDRFDGAQTVADVEAIGAEVRDAMGNPDVKNERRRLLDARQSAMARVRP